MPWRAWPTERLAKRAPPGRSETDGGAALNGVVTVDHSLSRDEQRASDHLSRLERGERFAEALERERPIDDRANAPGRDQVDRLLQLRERVPDRGGHHLLPDDELDRVDLERVLRVADEEEPAALRERRHAGGHRVARGDQLEDHVGPEAGGNSGSAQEAADLPDDLERLGPTFVKLGQLLSSRADLLPERYLKSLSRLQDKVKPFPFRDVEDVIEGRPPEGLRKEGRRLRLFVRTAALFAVPLALFRGRGPAQQRRAAQRLSLGPARLPSAVVTGFVIRRHVTGNQEKSGG